MSEYHRTQTEFRDRKLFDQVAQEWAKQQGKEVRIHQEAQLLEGYQGDAREGFAAHVIIPRRSVGGAANDVGFVWKNGRYEAIISEYDSTYNGPRIMAQLNTLYTQAKLKKNAKKNGWDVFTETRSDGKIVMKVSGYKL